MSTVLENPVTSEVMPEDTSSLQGYFGSSCVGLFVIDSNSRFSYVNSRASEIFGFSSKEKDARIQLPQLDFFFSQAISDRIHGLLNNEPAFKVERFPGTNLAGHFAYYCLSCNPIYDRLGNVSGVLGIIEDFTEQEKKSQELTRTIDELSILSQISQVVSSALDTEEILKVILTAVTARQGLGFNRAFLFLLDENGTYLNGRLAIGPSSAEEAGSIWGTLVHDDRSLFEALSKYNDDSGKGHGGLFDLIRGQRIDISNGSLFAMCIRDKKPVVISEETKLDPVTERIFSRLNERHAAMTPLISQDRPIGLLIVDNAITHERITEQDCQFLKLIADQSASAVERSYLYRDIKDRAVELERMNTRLAEIQNQIIEAEKMSVIGEITSAVAHELRNPLAIIGGFANLLNKNCTPDSPEAEYLSIIVSETQRAESVLTDVLDFSKASKKKDKLLDFNVLVKESLDMMALRLHNGKQPRQFNLNPDPLMIWGNSDQLRHSIYQIVLTVIQDLGDSAHPIAQTYRIENTARLEIGFTRNGKNVEEIEKSLGQYFCSGNSTKRLGLLVAEEALKHHGGDLGIESHTKEGPFLYIELPLRLEDGNV